MNKRKGFTLVEVMLAVLILGIGLSVIANSYMAAVRGISTAQNNIQAMVLAKEKFDEFEVSSLMQKGLTPVSASDAIQSSGKNYNYSLNIAEVSDPEYISKYLVKACLTFSWQEQGAPKNVLISSYFPKYKENEEDKKETNGTVL